MSNTYNINYYLANTYTNEADTGRFGKAFECATRSALSGRRVDHIKEQGKHDAYFSFKVGEKRKQVTVEIKTACGEIATAHKSQFIIYCPEVNPELDCMEQGAVFTREEWTAFVNGYTGRGSFTRVNSRGELHIQSFRSTGRPKASKPIADYIWESCLSQPTVAEWLEMLRGE